MNSSLFSRKYGKGGQFSANFHSFLTFPESLIKVLDYLILWLFFVVIFSVMKINIESQFKLSAQK